MAKCRKKASIRRRIRKLKNTEIRRKWKEYINREEKENE